MAALQTIAERRAIIKRLRALFATRDKEQQRILESEIQQSPLLHDEEVQALLGCSRGLCRTLNSAPATLQSFQHAADFFKSVGAQWTAGFIAYVSASYCSSQGWVDKAVSYSVEAIKKFNELGDSTWEMMSLQYAGGYCGTLKQFQKAIEYLQSALLRSRELQSVYHEVLAHINLGVAQQKTGERAMSLHHYKAAIELLEKTSASDLTECYPEEGSTLQVPISEKRYVWLYCAAHINMSGVLQEMNAPYRIVAQLLQSAHDMYAAHGDLEGQAFVKSQLGWMHYSDGEFELAIQLLRESCEILKKGTSRPDLYQQVLANLARAYIAVDQPIEAEACLKTLNEIERADSSLAEVELLCLHARVAILSAKLPIAKDFCMKALEIARQRSEVTLIIECHLILADIAKYQDSAEHRTQLDSALMLAEETNDLSNMMSIHKLMSSHNKVMGNAAAALHHLETFYELQRKQQREQSQRTIENLRIINELNVYKLQAEMKESDNKRLQEQLEEKTQELSVFAMRILERQEFLAELERGLRLLLKANPAEVHERVYELIKHVKSANTGERDWQDFRSQFLHMHEDFIATLQHINPDLSPSELKVMALVRMRMSTKQIAEILHLSPRSVENHRNHVRKKLKLGPAQNLVGYLSSI